MDEFLTDFSSPRWWFSVVVAGIFVNIVAGYLKAALDTRFKAASGWWRRRRDYEMNERRSVAEGLRADPMKHVLFAISHTAIQLQSLRFVLYEVAFGAFALILVLFGAPKWLSLLVIALFCVSWFLRRYFDRAADRRAGVLEETDQGVER